MIRIVDGVVTGFSNEATRLYFGYGQCLEEFDQKFQQQKQNNEDTKAIEFLGALIYEKMMKYTDEVIWEELKEAEKLAKGVNQ